MKTSALAKFDAVLPFNAKYIKVVKGELCNLMDENGTLLSRKWFANITETSNGEYNFVERGSKKSILVPKATDLARYATLRSTLSKTPIWGNMDMSSVVFLGTPFVTYASSECKKIIIVAKSIMYGKTYLISDNGNVYDEDGERTSLPTFIIPQSYINTCVDLAHKFNTLYCPNYDGVKEHTSVTFETMKRDGISAFIFAFCDTNIVFNTNCKNIFHTTTIDAWGGDTIKLRIYMRTIAEQSKDIVEDFCKDEEFSCWKTNECYTKQYTLDEFHLLVADMESLNNLYYGVEKD